MDPSELPGRPVAFRAVDGVRLEGRLIGHGDIGVVLSHMGRAGDDQSDWFPLARILGRHGYTVLTYNRRGVCPGAGLGCSKGADDHGSAWKDVAGAYRYLRDDGIDHVVLGGASIGAMASLHAATRDGVRPAAVIWVAGILLGTYEFSRKTACEAGVPVLYSSADEDTYGAGPDAGQLYRWSRDSGVPAALEVIPSAEHGTDMLSEKGSREELVAAIVEFLADHVRRSQSATCR